MEEYIKEKLDKQRGEAHMVINDSIRKQWLGKQVKRLYIIYNIIKYYIYIIIYYIIYHIILYIM